MNQIADPARPAHYPSQAARRTDLIVHAIGLGLAVVGGAILLTLAAESRAPGLFVGVAVYTAGVLAMLAFSTAHNAAPSKPLLHRLDRAGIFLMIAGTYTPFTTQNLSGAWAWGMTLAVWILAGLGALGQVLLPKLDRRIWVVAYLGLGWMAVVALKPIVQNTTWICLVLLALGGLLYTSGVVFYLNRRLQYARAIWHSHVLAAAGAHWAAVLLGVVLVARG